MPKENSNKIIYLQVSKILKRMKNILLRLELKKCMFITPLNRMIIHSSRLETTENKKNYRDICSQCTIESKLVSDGRNC